MEKQLTFKNIVLNYGFYAALASIIIGALNYGLGGNIYNPSTLIQLGSIIIFIVIVVLGINAVKKIQEGGITFGKAFKTGFMICLISTLIYMLYNILFTSFIEPDFYANLLEIKTQELIDNKPDMSEEGLEAASKAMKMFMNPIAGNGMFLIASLFFGTIISLIVAAVMKKDRTA